MSAPQATNPPSGEFTKFTELPNELVLLLAHYMTIRSLRGLSVASKRYRGLLGGRFQYQEEVKDERLFEEAQRRFRHLCQTKGLQAGKEKRREAGEPIQVPWPTSIFVLQPVSDFVHSRTPLSEDDYALLHDSVGRWGRGALFLIPYLNPLKICPTWSKFKALHHELPVSQTRRSLIQRAIEKCSDIKVLEQVVDAYLKMHPASLQGTTGRDPVPRVINKDRSVNLPPVFWACVHNRADVLELLLKKNNEDGRRAEDRVNFNLVLDTREHLAVHDNMTAGLLQYSASFVDLWKAAFYHPRVASIVSRRSFYANDDVCLWLLDKNLGFASQTNGNSLRYLSKAAAFKKARILRALIPYFESRMDPWDFQRALAKALRTTTMVRFEVGSLGLDLKSNGPVLDGHEEVIDILAGAGAPLSIPHGVWQNPEGNSFTRGLDELLEQAVKSSPRNAVHLLRHQLAQGATDYLDLRRALRSCIQHANQDNESGYNTCYRLEFFRMVFPGRVHLLHPHDDCQHPETCYEVYKYETFVRRLARDIRWEFTYKVAPGSEFHRLALYLVEVAGHEQEVADLVPWMPPMDGRMEA
ncbi:hypothetical protein PGQ11_009887 [Apiospora arundinis]|uniref:F-box domain-containing protein n=1 Tax=Apiospora arundinis TaxID=335852 RepID=A0ABR2I8T5_9PEZI